ncbi:MAG: hypothetical protein QGG50_08075 [Methanopyri archaeon]|nr:hypothetical protein [Methanopyri archaeon]
MILPACRRSTAVVLSLCLLVVGCLDSSRGPSPQAHITSRSCSLGIPGVILEEGTPVEGMMITLTVSVRTNSSTDSLDVTGDEAFLEAFNSARMVAGTSLYAPLGERSVMVETDYNASLVGRSGGAALALLMTCAANGTVPREGITVSAGVRSDGSLVGVAHLPAKCAAVLDAGLHELWIAEEDAQVITWEERQDPVTGQVRRVQRDLPVAEACSGIRVRTARNISELAHGMLSPPRQEH